MNNIWVVEEESKQTIRVNIENCYLKGYPFSFSNEESNLNFLRWGENLGKVSVGVACGLQKIPTILWGWNFEDP